jgi:tetratricopeptide (TPR) repeat protein
MTSHIFKLGFIVAALILANGSGTADEIPPIQQLITETLALCEADRENNAAALAQLAQAQSHLGDFAAARKTLGAFSESEDFRLTVAHLHCAQIEIQLTGSTAAITEPMWEYGGGTMHYSAALAFVERGEIDKALEHINRIPKSPNTLLSVFRPNLIQKLIARNESDAARKVALSWASRLNLASDIGSYRSYDEVPRLVAWLVEFNERPTAKAVCDHWHSVLVTQTAANPASLILARCWAEYGKALAALGPKEAASSALDQAHECIEASLKTQFGPIRRGFYGGLAEACAVEAAQRAVIFGPDTARATYLRAWEFAGLSVDPRDRQHGDLYYVGVIRGQLEAGDIQGAQETAKQALAPRTAARCWLVISSHALSQEDMNLARAAVQSACTLLDRDGFESFVAEEMALAASNAGRAGEKEMAQKLFKRAIGLSDADKSPKSKHPFIASFQAHGGLLSDAYQTIQSIPTPANRAEPLATLCLELAKQERASRNHSP